jgi:predicted PurR-regulated permease PerM
VRLEIPFKTFLLAALVAAGCWIVIHLLGVILVVMAALVLAGTLNPAVSWLERKGLRRNWAVALVFLAMLVGVTLIGIITIPTLVEQVRSLVAQEPQLRNRLADLLARTRATAGLADSLRQVHYDTMVNTAFGTLWVWSTRAFEIIAYLVSAVFLALYIMLDRDRLRGGLFAAVPRRYHIRLSRIMLNLETIVGGYIRGQLLTSALMAVFVGVLLTACGISNAVALAALGGAADILPYVGVILTVGPAAIAAASKGIGTTIVVVIMLLAYEEFESRILVPRVYGRVLRLPSSVVLLALLTGGTLLGIIGALIALPIAAAIRMMVEELRVNLPGERNQDWSIEDRDQHAEEEYERRAAEAPAEKAAAIAIEISEARRNAEGGPLAAADATIRKTAG